MLQHAPFFLLQVVASIYFVHMMRHIRRRWRWSAQPLGKKALKRLKRVSPQLLARAEAREQQFQKFWCQLSTIIHFAVPLCQQGFCYYCGARATGWASWFAAALVLQGTSWQWHANSKEECKHLSLMSTLIMAEGRVSLSMLGVALAFLQPMFAPECDRCGGDRASESCPRYREERSQHADAWAHFNNVPALEVGDGSNIVLQGAAVQRQPSDGHCLFHSLACGLATWEARATGTTLREDIANFLSAHPTVVHSGYTFAEWIQHDTQLSVPEYCACVRRTQEWDGALEIAVFVLLKHVHVHVYERRGSQLVV